MPGISVRILELIGAPTDVSHAGILPFGQLAPGVTVTAAQALFPRVERLNRPGEQAGTGKQAAEGAKEDNLIDISEFGRIEMKVGKILEATAVEKSDKLVILKVDVGRTIQIVAGIGKAYRPEELPGTYIAVMTNLKPAKLMGLPSEGMLLATDAAEGRLALVGFDRPPKVGARIR